MGGVGSLWVVSSMARLERQSSRAAMTPELQSHEPRSAVIVRHTVAAMRSSARMCMRKFAANVAERYIATTALVDRHLTFHDPGSTIESAVKAEKANAQLVTRILDGTVRFPVDLEEAWVGSLIDPFRMDCARELARRYGFLGAVAPRAGDSAAVQLGDLAMQFGAVMQALAPVMADGRIDAEDAPAQLIAALKVGTDLQAAWVSLQARLVDALPAAARGRVPGVPRAE